MTITTDRLLLRDWRPEDRAPFAALNADPQVMRYFPSVLTPAESDALAARVEAQGVFAVESREDGEFIGYVGLAAPTFDAHFTPCVEIGWRLASRYWNRGLATEGARAVLAHAFATRGLRQVVSFTVTSNLASRRVMEKIGMTRNPADDFDHPGLPEGHPLRRHVLYRIDHSQ